MRDLPVTQPYLTDGPAPTPWSLALAELRTARTFWVATTCPDGRPHVVPVLAVVSDGALHVAASPSTRKVKNLTRDGRVSVTAQGRELDLVVEGDARLVRDARELAAVVAAYEDTYGWPVEVRDGALHGEGAPTAGPPPYRVFRISPRRAFGFPVTGSTTPTRWLFGAATAHAGRGRS